MCFHLFLPPSSLVSRQVGFLANISCLPAHQMTQFCIYSKRPLQFPQKSCFNHKGSKFRGVAPLYLVLDHVLWANEFIEKFIANPQKCDYVIWLVTLRERKNKLLIKTKPTKELPF